MRVYGAEAACSLLVLDGLSNDVIVGLSWQRAARLTIQLGEPHDMLNGREVVHSQRSTAEAVAARGQRAAARGQASSQCDWRRCSCTPASQQAGQRDAERGCSRADCQRRATPSCGRCCSVTATCSPRRCP